MPNNSLGKSAVPGPNDVHPDDPDLAGGNTDPPLGRVYLETGYGIRPSKVIYDRKHSAMAEYDFSDVDLGGCWRTLTGCT